MSQRLAAIIALIGLLALGVLLSNGLGQAQTALPGRMSFQIATGSTAGTNFPVGQAIAGLISHPPGVGRCETATVCGPAGLILSARTSSGSLDNLRMIDSGLVDSAIVTGDAIAESVKGTGAFRRKPLSHLRVIAALYPEQVHLLAMKPNIESVSDLRGKRVLMGLDGSATNIVARRILTAWRVPERGVKKVSADSGNEVALLKSGKADALFLVAGMPLDAVREALAGGAHLVPLDGKGRERLLKLSPSFSPAVIAGVYPGAAPVETVATRAWWITRDSAPDALIYGITRSLFNPANHAALAASHYSARAISIETAAKDPPAPLHGGAARLYREKRVLEKF